MPSWHACYTRARTEKKVAERLERKGFTTYLPLIPRVRQWKDREKVVPFPVFPSYVFCRFDTEQHRDVVTTPGVVAVLSHGGEPAVIPDGELDNVRRFVDAVATTGREPEPVPEFEAGQGVRVVSGPFRGVTGSVRELRGRKRLLVGISGLGQGLEVDIAADGLEPLPG